MYGILDDNEQLLAKFVAPIRVESIVPSFVSDSLSLKRNARKRSGQRWEIASNLEPLSHTSNGLFALFVKKGNTGIYKLKMPQNYGAVKSRAFVPGTHTATASADSTSIQITTSSYIPAGTFVQFENSSKIYLTLTARSRSGPVEISPRLHTSLANTPFKWRDDLVMLAYLEVGAVRGMSFTDGILMDNGELTFVEKV